MKTSPRIITLMYHRIDEQDTDPWGICVSPGHFEEHVRVIKKHLPVVTAEEVIKIVSDKNITESCACITFDDGYADNYLQALPVLKAHSCPATFFIATAYTGNSFPFWWDELEMICLHSKELPGELELMIKNKSLHFSFETELTNAQWQQHLAWKWYDTAPTQRCRSFLYIWKALRRLSFPEISDAIDAIRNWAKADFHTRLPMSHEHLRKLQREDIATTGLHTHTHPDLASHNAVVQAKDISMGKEKILSQYGKDSSILAYPYGNHNEETRHAIQKLNLSGCFTTNPVSITNGSDPFALGRFQVFDWNGQQFEEQLQKWMTD